MKNGRIAGTGSYVPETIWKNEDLEKMVDTSDIWIRERTGIGARHIAGEETVAQMAVKAARRALENAGITRCIRAFEGKGPDEGTPIIAMTANVFADDVKACLDAGMNSHVGKPLDMKILMAEILKYTNRTRSIC